MDLTHRFSVPAPVEEAWTAFNHLDRLAPCFPGAMISDTSGDRFAGSMKIKLGPLALVYDGTGHFLERDPAGRRVVFEAQGADRRGLGTATARVTASFVADGAGTEVELRTDLDLTGRPAQFGRGVIADVSDKLLDQFVSCITGRFADGLGAPAGDEFVARDSVAADDELWDAWAASSPAWPAEDPSDAETTLEIETTAEAAEPDDEPAEGPPEPPPVGPPPPPFRYSPPRNVAEPHARVTANVVSTLVRRYGPALGVGSLVVVIIVRLLQRRRR